MKNLDIPPVWLALFIIAAWALTKLAPEYAIDFRWQGEVAFVLLMAAVVLIGLAVYEIWQAGTTLHPHRDADALVTKGIYRLSRNPIYLGDLLILLAFVIWMGVWIALPMVALLQFLLGRRFIAGEETRLADKFGEDYGKWQQSTRRWI